MAAGENEISPEAVSYMRKTTSHCMSLMGERKEMTTTTSAAAEAAAVEVAMVVVVVAR